MWGFGKKHKIRRQRAKKIRADAMESAWTAFTRRVGLWPTFMWAVFFVLVMLIASVGERALPYSLNQKIEQPIQARVDFQVEDPKQAAANIKAAREAVPNYYRVNIELIDRIISELTNMYSAAQEGFEEFEAAAETSAWPADRDAYDLLQAESPEVRERYTNSLGGLRNALMRERIARPPAKVEREPQSTSANVIVQRPAPAAEGERGEGPAPTVEEEVPTLNLNQLANKDAIEGRAHRLALNFDQQLRPAVRQVLIRMLSEEPILVYDRDRTVSEMAIAERNAPPGVRRFEKGKPFIFARSQDDGTGTQGEEPRLTRTDLDLLLAEQAAFQRFLQSADPEAVKLRNQRRWERIGVGMVLLVLTLSLFVYVGLYQKRVFEVHARSIAFSALLVSCLGVVRFMDMQFARAEYTLVPVLLAAAILTIAYPRRFAAGVTVVFVVIVALIIRADIGTMITLFVGGYLTALMLNDIRTRTQIITVGLLTAALVFFLSFAFDLIDRQEVTFALSTGGAAAFSAVLAALIIQGTLPFIERAFRVATSLTLLEYRDANQPLLQRLAREAPGTYNHSLVLGTMAEAACEAIGANGRLAHVGALYHDIGKIPKVEYFSENQEAAINRHESLAPTMSLLIILGHVKDGLELAKEYGLPRVLYPFISEHHGTTVVKYFHHVASEKHAQSTKGKHDREVPETEFRYPGPKPTSKETAILMLCDGVEGAVRALHEPTAGRIEGIVHQVLQARLKDGQFDECDITLRELHRVEESLVKSLCRFYHGRVAYPKDSKDSKEKDTKGAPVKSDRAKTEGQTPGEPRELAEVTPPGGESQ